MRNIRYKQKEYLADPIYKDKLVTYLVNNLMRNGKKYIAYKIFYDTLKHIDNIKVDKNKSAFEIFKIALNNIRPQIILKKRRIGSITQKIAVNVNETKSLNLSIK